MASTLSSLPGILARWAADDSSRTETLRKWRDDAITQAAENHGAQIRSANAHGISFSVADGLTWDQWLLVLDAALLINTRNVAGTTKAIARFQA